MIISKLRRICSLLFFIACVTGIQSTVNGALLTPPATQILKLAEKDKAKVKIRGQVAKPTAIAWTKNLTLKKALKKAGGTTKLANTTKVKVTRGNKVFTVDLRKVDPMILPGDIIDVPERFF